MLEGKNIKNIIKQSIVNKNGKKEMRKKIKIYIYLYVCVCMCMFLCVCVHAYMCVCVSDGPIIFNGT